MNKGTIVLVGCALGAGGLFYMSTGADASRPVEAPETPVVAATKELAHSQTTPKASSTPSPVATAKAAATPSPQPLTLTQIRNLPRPAESPPPMASGPGIYPPLSEAPGLAIPETEPPPGPTATPATATPSPAVATAVPTSVPATPAATQHPWPLPVPPTLPPYPDAGAGPHPPTE